MKQLHVHLISSSIGAETFSQSVVVVIDVLRATTTIAAALQAGSLAVYPCATIEQARERAQQLQPTPVVLAGERDGIPIAGFDAGNSPLEFTPDRCQGAAVVLTTSNGTRALAQTRCAAQVLTAAFVNRRAVCEQLRWESCPVHILCAGDAGGLSLEDSLLAGALAEELQQAGWTLDDAAHLALAAWLNSRANLLQALRSGQGGVRLRQLGYDEDILWASRLDVIDRVPRLQGEPPRLQ